MGFRLLIVLHSQTINSGLNFMLCNLTFQMFHRKDQVTFLRISSITTTTTTHDFPTWRPSRERFSRGGPWLTTLELYKYTTFLYGEDPCRFPSKSYLVVLKQHNTDNRQCCRLGRPLILTSMPRTDLFKHHLPSNQSHRRVLLVFFC